VLHVHFTAFDRRVCMIQLKLLHLYAVSSVSLEYFKVQYEQNFRLSGLLHSRFRTFQKKRHRRIRGPRSDETGYTLLTL
jgi:choline-glycine betaine transporter